MWKGFVLVVFLSAVLDDNNNGCNAAASIDAPIPASSKQFFLEGGEPTGLTGDAAIEQTHNTMGPYFFTMYSKAKRSPVYSAYRVLPADAANLGLVNGGGDWEEYVGDPGHDLVYRANTSNGKYTRGHLNPSNMNSFDQNSQSSTYTFSNAVPQWEASNNLKWKQFETSLMNYAKDKCGADDGTLYLLTGPGDFDYNGVNKIPVTQPVRIESADKTQSLPVPPVLWTAGCCWNKRSGAESLGVIGLNRQAKGDAVKYNVGLIELQKLLGGFSLFPGDVDDNCEKKNAQPFPLGKG